MSCVSCLNWERPIFTTLNDPLRSLRISELIVARGGEIGESVVGSAIENVRFRRVCRYKLRREPHPLLSSCCPAIWSRKASVPRPAVSRASVSDWRRASRSAPNRMPADSLAASCRLSEKTTSLRFDRVAVCGM